MQFKRVLRGLGFGILGVLGLVLLLVAGGWWFLRASLAKLDGRCEILGLSAPVTVERDALAGTVRPR